MIRPFPGLKACHDIGPGKSLSIWLRNWINIAETRAKVSILGKASLSCRSQIFLPAVFT